MTQHDSSSPGCTTSCRTAEPIACTIGGREQQIKRVADFGVAFEHLLRTEILEGGFRWHFRADSEQELFLRGLAQRENECCRFFDFRLTRDGATVVWETRAPDQAAEVLEAFRRLPETLGELDDNDALKSAFSESGLKFIESPHEGSR